jgi:hypothetical protein
MCRQGWLDFKISTDKEKKGEKLAILFLVAAPLRMGHTIANGRMGEVSTA